MKVTYTTENERIKFEIEVQTGKAAFECVASIQELFEEPDCGCCKGKNIYLSARGNDKKFYAVRCRDCGAQLDISQTKEGGKLFAKRIDQNSNQAMPNCGWYVDSGEWRQKQQEKRQQHGGGDFGGGGGYGSGGHGGDDMPF